MNYDIKHKIAFYNACYYLCGLSNEATSYYHDKRIQITDTLDACTYCYLEQDYDFDEAYFSIHFERNKKNIWGTIIKLNSKKAGKVSEFFENKHNNIDYILTTLTYLKPTNSAFAHMPTPQISIEEQDKVIEISTKMIKNTLELANSKTKSNKKIRKLIK